MRLALSDEILEFLSSTELFSGLDMDALRKLEPELEWMRIQSGEILIRQGDPGDCLYVLIIGRLRVYYHNDRGEEVPVAEIGQGECVGEMSIFAEEPRSATVRAIRDSELVRLTRSGVEKLLRINPDAILKITRSIVKRLRRLTRGTRYQQTISTIALVPVSPSAPITSFARELTCALTRHAPTLHMNAQTFMDVFHENEAVLDDQSQTHSKFTTWLNQQEIRHRYIIYEAEHEPGPWTRACLRYADRILLVGRYGGSPSLSENEIFLRSHGSLHTGATQELVLLHEGADLPIRGTSEWLARRQVRAHHHINIDTPEGAERMARRLAGKAIGMVLGGGGARGFAHIGVIRAMYELGIPIDCVGGASMGAVIAAQAAMRWNLSRFLSSNREGFIENQPLRDYTLPFLSVISGRKYARMLQRMFGDTMIEDLPLRFFCVSSDLTHAELVVHDRGPLWNWLRASSALPGVGPPVFHEGRLLVDGAVMNNLPTDVMRGFCEGIVIAVDVGNDSTLETDPRFQEAPTGLEILIRRFAAGNPNTGLPGIFDVLHRAATLHSLRVSRQTRLSADVLIQPPVGAFKMLDFSVLHDVESLGYQHAIDKLKEWAQGQKWLRSAI
ncbi:MAG: putative NTE family protein [Myxococcota bacterium]|nr:putative NTE family protein [Myxococcota bacterium]